MTCELWLLMFAAYVGALVYGGHQRRKGYLIACTQVVFKMRSEKLDGDAAVKALRSEVESERWWW
jgi:hypothetical protein